MLTLNLIFVLFNKNILLPNVSYSMQKFFLLKIFILFFVYVKNFLLYQISIFMTHQNNYANDRLAIYIFETVVKFLKCWTNIQLLSDLPVQLSEKYFRQFPHEVDPIWGVSFLYFIFYSFFSYVLLRYFIII